MRRYSIEMSTMEWVRVLNNLASVENPSGSTDKLRSLIFLMMDHEEDPDFTDLPYNIRKTGD